MQKILIDTDIMNYIIKKETPELSKFESFLEEKKIVLSFVTIAELSFWRFQLIENKKNKREIQNFMNQLNNLISDCEIINSNVSISQIAASLAYDYKRKNKKEKADNPDSIKKIRFSKRWHDFWIAATALEYKLMLVTNNIDDFKNIKGVEIYEPK